LKKEWTRDTIIKTAREEKVEFIHLQFTDLTGVMKNVSIDIEQLEKALDGQIMFDGSSIDGFVRIEESDMILKPDYNTFMIFPWSSDWAKEARLICDVYKTDGNPFEGCPRNILKKNLEKAKKLGYTMHVGPECEFFLFNTNEKGEPSLETHDQAAYFDMAPIDLGGNARKEIVLTLKQMGFEIEASHHECAPGQHEIDFKFDDALTSADNIMTFKLVVRIIAQRHGLHATFMPKPVQGIAGSGMHINMSLSDNKGNNVFYKEEDVLGLSEIAYSYLAGILKHAKGLAALTNPTVNSYKRLVPGFEAPVYIAWSASNRSPLVRVPASRGKGTRVELRNPDPSANPYLALSGILATGLDGIENKLTAPKSTNNNVYEMTKAERRAVDIHSLPATLIDAIKELGQDELLIDAIGMHAYKNVKSTAKYEWYAYSKCVSSWELNRYLKKF